MCAGIGIPIPISEAVSEQCQKQSFLSPLSLNCLIIMQGSCFCMWLYCLALQASCSHITKMNVVEIIRQTYGSWTVRSECWTVLVHGIHMLQTLRLFYFLSENEALCPASWMRQPPPNDIWLWYLTIWPVAVNIVGLHLMCGLCPRVSAYI